MDTPISSDTKKSSSFLLLDTWILGRAKPRDNPPAKTSRSLAHCVHLINSGASVVGQGQITFMAATAVSSSGMSDRTSFLPPASIIFGSSVIMQAIQQKVDKVASSGVPI